jgi:hypothetical protein
MPFHRRLQQFEKALIRTKVVEAIARLLFFFFFLDMTMIKRSLGHLPLVTN